MDPLTAFSVAGTVIQFVDFGHQLLRNTVQLYKSSRGALEANEELELVTGDLRGVISKLRKSCSTIPSNPATSVIGDGGSQGTLMIICDEAAKIATELLEKLDTLKVNDGKHRRWNSFKAALRAAWSKEEIKLLEGRLSRLKESIQSGSFGLFR
jgi:hypothetical protein